MARRLLFAVNNAAFFVSHRLPIALAAREAGYEVGLVTGQAGSIIMEPRACAVLKEHAISHTATAFTSDGTNPWRELRGLIGVRSAMRAFSPDIVHAVSPKGILYGGLSARSLGVQGLVIAISGMGSLFTGDAHGLRSVLRKGYSTVATAVYRHPRKRVIVQNIDDRDAVLAARWAKPAEVVLIPGSGVDLDQFAPVAAEQALSDIVVLPGRVLREKGVVEFVEAARILKARGVPVRMVLVGTADYRNPSAVARSEIEQWVASGDIEWWGHRDDMAAVYREASIVCLPSYREGMPKVLLEAAAAGKPVVTTDVEGCREAIVPGRTGLMVKARDAMAIADSLQHLLQNRSLQRAFGVAARQLAEEKYGIDSVIKRSLAIYDSL